MWYHWYDVIHCSAQTIMSFHSNDINAMHGSSCGKEGDSELCAWLCAVTRFDWDGIDESDGQWLHETASEIKAKVRVDMNEWRKVHHVETSVHLPRWYTTNDRACSAVFMALRFGTQGPRFEPGLFHKAFYMPLHGCWRKLKTFYTTSDDRSTFYCIWYFTSK